MTKLSRILMALALAGSLTSCGTKESNESLGKKSQPEVKKETKRQPSAKAPSAEGNNNPPKKVVLKGSAGSFNKDPKTIKVAFYNLENLFDTAHDTFNGKDRFDGFYLPANHPEKERLCNLQYPKKEGESKRTTKRRNGCIKNDWNEEKFSKKLDSIKELFLREKTELPDALGVCELENGEVLTKLAERLGYKEYAVSHGYDKRGIKLGFLYNHKKFDLVKIDTHEVKHEVYFSKKPTRGIFEVQLKAKATGKVFSFLVNHWPSLGNPTSRRVVASQAVASIIDKRKSESISAIVMGDFNTASKDVPNPISGTLTGMGNPDKFDDDRLVDVHQLYFYWDDELKKIFKKDDAFWGQLYVKKNAQPKGTYFWSGDNLWNRLDRILITPDLMTGEDAHIDLLSYEIYYPEFATKEYEATRKGVWGKGFKLRVPKKFYEGGYSDHLPVFLDVKLK